VGLLNDPEAQVDGNGNDTRSGDEARFVRFAFTAT
jgi:hypothetical protein